MTVTYPDITVELEGQDGNGFTIVGRVSKALRRHGVDSDEIKRFRTEATSGDYDHLLQTVMEWVEVG